MESQAYYDQLVHLVGTFPEDAGPLIDATDWIPAPGFQVEREMREVPDEEALRTSLALGAQALEHAGEAMFALAEACRTPVKTFSAFTLARGILESAARALWLFDTDIRWAERVTRGMSLRLQGLDSQRKFARLVNKPIDEHIHERKAQIIEKANQMGLKVLSNSRGVTGFGSGIPKRGELTRRIAGGESDYRAFSAGLHGEFWASGFQKSDRENFAVKQTDPVKSTYVCVRSIEYFAHALWAEVHIYGWKSGPFAQLLEKTYNSLSLRPERRFWRHQATEHM